MLIGRDNERKGFLSHAVLILTAVVFGGFLLSCNVENDNPSVPTMPDDVPTPEPRMTSYP